MSDTMTHRGHILAAEIDHELRAIEFEIYLANRTMPWDLDALLAGKFSDSSSLREPSTAEITDALQRKEDAKRTATSAQARLCEIPGCRNAGRYILLNTAPQCICAPHWQVVPIGIKRLGYEDWRDQPIPDNYHGPNGATADDPPEYEPYEDTLEHPDTLREQDDPDA